MPQAAPERGQLPERAASPYIIPIFVSHQGCPHQCVFCNQHSITGGTGRDCPPVGAGSVRREIAAALARPRKNPGREVQVAFYGGSFTGMPMERQEELLGAVQPFIDRNQVQQIRLSTRPDYIDAAGADFLKAHRVGIVELGVQSLDDTVLAAAGRGHSAARSIAAVTLLKQKGFVAGVQLMIGLPGQTRRSCLAGAKRLAALAPHCVRIYPTVVVRGSGLAGLYGAGRYRPLTLAQAVALTARLKEIFDRHGVPVIRMGLQASTGLERDLLDGPYHPAFGELVMSRLFFKKVRSALAQSKATAGRLLSVAAADQSILRGPNNGNLDRLKALGLFDRVTLVFDAEQARNTVAVKEI